jgi:hypothetical protein
MQHGIGMGPRRASLGKPEAAASSRWQSPRSPRVVDQLTRILHALRAAGCLQHLSTREAHVVFCSQQKHRAKLLVTQGQ